jgi:hypothetical protein
MSKCHITGVWFPLEKAFFLNRRMAAVKLAVLEDKVEKLKWVIENLGELDRVEVYNKRTGRYFKIWQRRLVSPIAAAEVAKLVGERKLFTRMGVWRALSPEERKEMGKE